MDPVELAKSNTTMDDIEREIAKMPAGVYPLIERFADGVYCREVSMVKNSLVTSKIHRTEHFFVVLQGRVTVWSDEGRVTLSAGHIGITRRGTRRIVFAHDFTRWATFHATTLTDPAAIEAEIIEPHSEHLAGLIQPTVDELAALTEGAPQ